MKSSAESAFVTAPIRGLQTEIPLPQMHPQDAVRLDNVVCRTGYLEVRKGWTPHKTGFASPVITLFVYHGVTPAGNTLHAAAGSGIYNATTAGAVGAAVVSGLTNDRWSYTQVSNVAGNFLIAVNGTNTARTYDGTTWSVWGATGVATTALSQITTWKRRVWVVEQNTFKAWYSAADAITGALTSFTLAGIFHRGGSLLAIIPWTVDAGEGVDDYLLFVTTQGEVAVYKGTDPASATTFTLQGLYYIGTPIGSRFWAQVGGDVFLLTAAGVVSFSSFLQAAVVGKKALVTGRVNTEIRDLALQYSATAGWELVNYPEENLLFLLVPLGSGNTRRQYVMNTETGAWSRFTTLTPLRTYAVFNKQLYAGYPTQVINAWTGGTDDGEAIHYKVVPAFNTFKKPSQGKKFSLGRVFLEADYVPAFRTKLLLDYKIAYTITGFVAMTQSAATWGTALWGAATWGGAAVSYQRLVTLGGFGRAATIAFEGKSTGEVVRIIGFEYTYSLGGIL